MNREECLDWLYRLKSEIFVYMPEKWLVSMGDALEMAIEALEHPERNVVKVVPCGDAISRTAALNTLDTMNKALDENRTVEEYKEFLRECYEQLPSVSTEKTGRWIDNSRDGYTQYYCSCCCDSKSETSKKSNYCPNCGCRMIEPQESEVQDADCD